MAVLSWLKKFAPSSLKTGQEQDRLLFRFQLRPGQLPTWATSLRLSNASKTMMTSNTVNYFLIYSALGYLTIAEAQNASPLRIDPNSKASVVAAFSKFVLPEISRWSSARRERLKLSLAYFLRKPQILEDEVLGNMQDLTMAPPYNIVLWFSWMFEALFPYVEIESVDIRNLKEDNDILQMNFEPGDPAQ
jgi:hypothetical protein